MTLGELKTLIDRIYSSTNSRNLDRINNLTVCIPNNEICMGGTSTTKVSSCNPGFDFDKDKFFIHPEKPMKEIK